jgi:PAS domain S-box-containing protein
MFKKLNIFKKNEKKTWKNSLFDDYLMEQLEEMKTDLNEDTLQIKKDLFHLLKYFNKSPFVYTIIDCNTNIIKYNTKLKEIINNRTSKLLGNSITTYIHDDDINQLKYFLDNLGETEETEVLRIISNEGKLYYIKWYGVKLEDEQLYLLFGQDITEEVTLSEKIREVVKYKDVVLDNYPGAIICLDKYGKILEFNNSATNLTGYSKSDVYKKHIYDLLPDKDLFKEENMESIYKVRIMKKNGRKQNVYLLNTPLFDGNKKVGYTLIFHDQTYVNYMKKALLK